MLVDCPELAQIAIRLLEVVAVDFLVLLRPAAFAIDSICPAHKPFVELRTRPFQESVVRRVLDQDVHEAEAGVIGIGGRSRPHELLAGHRLEVVRDQRTNGQRRQLGNRRLGELETDDRGRFDHRPLVLAKEVEAGGEERLDGWWDDHL